MADPTIQTFCCHPMTSLRSVTSHDAAQNVTSQNNVTSLRNYVTNDLLLEQFHSMSYNVVCLACACIGIIGAVYQILPRKALQPAQRTLQTCRLRDIIMWLAVADLMATLGVFLRSAVWLLLGSGISDAYTSIIFCTVSSGWIQYFYTCTWLWTLSYAIHVRRSLKGQSTSRAWNHALCWAIPALLTGLALGVLYSPEYIFEGSKGSYTLLRILPAFCATYVPILIVMVVNPCLYSQSSKHVLWILTLTSGQVTSKERSATNSVTFKFFMINVAFYICWLPNLLNGILLWTLWLDLPPVVITTLWYIMAVTNPMQAALNALVYNQRRIGASVRLPYCCSSDRSGRRTADESTPLLSTNDDVRDPYWSLNNSTSYL